MCESNDTSLADQTATACGASIGDVQTRKNLCLTNQPTGFQSLFAIHVY